MRELLAVRPGRRGVLAGVALALLLLPFDLGRQLLVLDDPSLLHALLVDVVGFLAAAAGQVALVGVLARDPAPLRDGTRRLLAAARRSPALLGGGLLAAGAVSALLTLPASVAALGVRGVLGPLGDPSLGALLVAGLSDALATAVTAGWFAALVVRLAPQPVSTTGAAGPSTR